MINIREYKALQNLKSSLIIGFSDAKDAFNLITSDEPNKELLANYKLNQSMYNLSIAKSLYLSKLDIFGRYEMDDIFTSYDLFLNEFVESIIANRGYGHLNLSFKKLENKMDFIENTITPIDMD